MRTPYFVSGVNINPTAVLKTPSWSSTTTEEEEEEEEGQFEEDCLTNEVFRVPKNKY